MDKLKNTLNMSPDTKRQVLKAKALARANRDRRNMTLFTGVLAGLASAFVVVGLSDSNGFDVQTTTEISVALGLFVACLLVYWRSNSKDYPQASCPVCGYDWEIKEGRGVQTKDAMTDWKNCPGCHTPMDDRALRSASST